jgi:hypothetical protein
MPADRVFAQVAERGIALITRVNLAARFRLSLAHAVPQHKHITAHQQAVYPGYLEYGAAVALILTIMDI